MTRLETLKNLLQTQLPQSCSLKDALSELTLDVPAGQWVDICAALRDTPALSFELCVDLCGVDYATYGEPAAQVPPPRFPQRYAVVLHLLSVAHNWRLRVRAWVQNDEFPVIDSLVNVWPSVNWFEREAFDLFGIVFEGHPDLRRILTDYGFIGHPFRKDFPLSGNVEMRYDTEQKRVIYQPVSIEPREITPRIVREEGYGVER
ncbi:MAG: NADH-quinone oxidoreductase subunit C [Pusillimonas sp.]|nr:NADH-quinone oxidoreductase subunit C [Pusillimonas sp.]